MVEPQYDMLDVERALAFALLRCYHVWDCDPEVAHFMCPKCRMEFTFDKIKDERDAFMILSAHLAEHFDADY